MYSPDAPIIGAASGTAEHVVKWLTARSDPSYTAYDIGTIVARYRDLGNWAGVDWFLALAQMAHETGSLTSWWSQRPRRNPAGIGVTGAVWATQPRTGAWVKRGPLWVEGCSFATWEHDAIPAHLGRLLAYALPAGQGTPAQQQLIAQALAIRPLPAAFRGAATRLQGLNGRWAWPGLFYAQKLAALANTFVRRV